MIQSKLKIVFCAVIALLSVETISAQSMYDAYKLSQSRPEGTARSMAMGNAFTALGGDLGSIAINPAASAVYRYSEFSITPNITVGGANTSYLGNRTTDSKTQFGISNLGLVTSHNTGRHNSGLVSWSFGALINKNNNFTSRMSAFGETAESSWLGAAAQSTNGIHSSHLDMNDDYDPFYESTAPWRSILAWNATLLDLLPDSNTEYIGATENINGYSIAVSGPLEQMYSKEVTGSISEAILNFGGNFANKLYIGASIGIQTISYKSIESYSENALNSTDFQTGFQSFTHSYNLNTQGTGINLKAGLIYLPVAGLRLGASISTPTWMYLQDEWEEEMSSSFDDGYSQKLYSPLGAYEYNLKTPFRWSVGAAYTFNKIGAISVDYEAVNYSQMKLSSQYNTNDFNYENSDIKESYGKSNILRVGAEINVAPQFALRGGYQYYSNGELTYNNYTPVASEYISAGAGYTSSNDIFLDIAYQQRLNANSESFWLYDDIIDGNDKVLTAAPEGLLTPNLSQFVVTLGFKF